MRKITTAFLIVFLGMLHMSMAQKNWVGVHSSDPTEAGIRLLESNIETTRIQFSLDGYYQQNIRTPRGTENILSLESGVLITEKGMPDLGKLYTSIVIPDLYEMDIKIISYKYEEYSNIAVAPSRGHFTRDIRPEDVPFEYGEAYNEDAFWPGELARLEEPFIMRDFRGQTVTVFPLQYNPVSQTLRVYTDIVLEVSTTTEPGRDAFERRREQVVVEREFGQIYNRFFINMEAAGKNYQVLEGEEGSLLIIAYDDFMDAMQPFVDWKRQTGRRTEIVSRTAAGNTAAGIKSFVTNYYNDNPDFAHLLLVGDAPTQMPVGQASGGQSDNFFGFLVGNNSYNDIFVGRFSAENVGHVETQVQRMIEYERDINESDTWLDKGMGIARNEGTGGGHNGENDYQHMDFIRDTLLNYTYTQVLKRYDGNVPGIPNTNATQMSGDFNEGVGIVNFCNHGSVTGWSVAGYSISHVNQLTNVGKLPFIWSVACVNGAFVNTFCFAEAWLRATHNGQPSGAIGMMASTINQPWQPPMTGQDEMVTLLAEQSIYPNINTYQRTFGGLSINGSMAMISAHGATGINTHQTWILFGDPTLRVRTGTPQVIAANYNPVILIGNDSFQVNAPDANGAFAALSWFDPIAEEVVIIGTGVVEDGVVNIDFDDSVNQPASFTLTITGFNKVTYINDDIQVIPPDGPYVVFDHYEIDDSAGNNNNQADYGETILLTIGLKNVGVESAANVNAVLTTESEFVTILQSEHAWGTIEEDTTGVIEGAFTFVVEEQIPDDHTVLFSLQITGEDDQQELISWNSYFSLKIYSPVLTIGSLMVDDNTEGDSNGRLDPGETADLVVRITNSGGAAAMAPIASLEAGNPYFTILESIVEPGIIPSAGYVDAVFPVQAHASVIPGTMVDLLFSVQDNHLVESEQFLFIGQVPELQIGDGTSPSVQYPFYNYYKANRSQMIYTAEELGAGEKTITEIGFDIIQASTQHNNLPNFVIRMMQVEQSTLSSFVNTSNAQVVFEVSSHQMPSVTGWHHFDIESFEYDGESNLLIEIVWGLLHIWTSDYYRVASTNVGANRTAFGFSDTQAVPTFNNTSQLRPNLHLAFEADSPEPANPVTFDIHNGQGVPIENAWIQLGSASLPADTNGEVVIELFPGNYTFDAHAEYFFPMTGLTFTVEDQPVTVDVVFAQEGMFFLSLNTSPANSGTTSGGGIYEEGTTITITAAPNTGYEFVSWTDETQQVISTLPDFEYIMPESNATLTANFDLINYSLNYFSGEHGTLEGDSVQIVSHGYNATPVTAIPDMGYHFDQWSDESVQNPRQDVNVTGDMDVTAFFAINHYEFALSVEGDGEVFVDDLLYAETLLFQHGATITLEAVPAEGWLFEGWSGDVEGNEAIIQVSMDEHKHVHAVFTEIPLFELTLESMPENGGIIQGEGMYKEGDEVELLAVPYEDYIFLHWEDDQGVVLSEEASFTYVMPAEDITLKGWFQSVSSIGELITRSITIYPNPASDHVNINSELTIQKVTVTDLNGRLILERNVGKQLYILNTEDFTEGIYVISIDTPAGVAVKMFMVKR
ncbi:MAG: T9SS C-terminal target domain-containing protein [Bacteroidetes bacterium]|nr:MAG: T9SS C-terminal target domain-containing protein [Bacteroidota bacterium]